MVESLDDFYQSQPATDVQPAFAGIDTFLKAPYSGFFDLEDADVAVFGVPYDGGVSYRPGTRFGPRGIRQASSWDGHLLSYSGEVTNTRSKRRVDPHRAKIRDCGDVPVFPSDPMKTGESIAAHTAEVCSSGTMPILLGGDHSCTFPAFVGVAEGTGAERVGFLQIDSHTDTVDETPLFGERFHGSTTHLVTESEYGTRSLVSQVGLSSYESVGYYDECEQRGTDAYSVRDVNEAGVDDVIQDALRSLDRDAIYVSFLSFAR